jgi:hypothetical protein
VKREDVSIELRRRAMVMQRAFSTPEGEEALKILTRQFGGSCYQKGDPYHTAYLEGGRDVLIYIGEMTSMLKENTDG